MTRIKISYSYIRVRGRSIRVVHRRRVPMVKSGNIKSN